MTLTADAVAQRDRDRSSASGTDLIELIEAVRDNAARLLSGVPHPPASLRLRAGAVAVELEWPPDGAGRTAPAAPGGAAGAMAAAPAAAEDGRFPILAPSVGVFYQAPEPDAAPFVSVGDTVAAGQQVGIVEVMKLMLPVEADRAGRVVEIVAGDGAEIEYGEPLLVLTDAARTDAVLTDAAGG
ncbi:acetyl-CoA carboxylase biotin carboxyl carrier protein subunit [Actinomadura sp. NAK00032]|uniref:acetyl-CoA carboxylase biotin carboxyl carrier protein n=1 Tax=Actinomadura sp. NAK00032 TaxID=2742128 RepID=UPI00159232CA|nr:biotin/lipoyl-containing protein [Actinomadura sp. NAK00032]QKW37602.1 acetyl-CoA carboxylase biotin carboxyl carrier protein subunit [Actinomadura sp. NAK00032]